MVVLAMVTTLGYREDIRLKRYLGSHQNLVVKVIGGIEIHMEKLQTEKRVQDQQRLQERRAAVLRGALWHQSLRCTDSCEVDLLRDCYSEITHKTWGETGKGYPWLDHRARALERKLYHRVIIT